MELYSEQTLSILQLFQADLAVSHAAARLVGQSALLDNLIEYLVSLDTFKIFPLVALLFAAALRQAARPVGMQLLVVGIFAGIAALIMARLVQNLGPMRLRPAFLLELEASAPLFGMALPDWSSFPSDTAALAFAIGMVVVRHDRWLGALALAWASLISIARVIAAFHYPSDILAGAIIGSVSALAVSGASARQLLSRSLDELLAVAPTMTCLLVVILLFQLATMFNDVRRGAQGVLKHAGILKETAMADTKDSPVRLPVLAEPGRE